MILDYSDSGGARPASSEEAVDAPRNSYRLGYRSDIEGLRAIAILLVVAAHARVPWLQGGFVGVDVFFVLSGYLITGLLVDEIHRTGSLRLLDFYARRLRRLLPALLLMVTCTCLAAAMLLAPFEQATQAPAATAASVWLSNWYFALSNLDYFGPLAESNLLLHTWSLGVEEQFYLMWPLLVLFLLGALRWQQEQRDFASLKKGMLATVIIGLALCLLLSYKAPPLAFYMMPARAWQFALGGLVLLGIRGADTLAFPTLRRWAIHIGWVGLALIIAAGLLLNAQTPYPGTSALLPSIGAAAVLYAGAVRPRSGIAAMLSLPPLQWLGRISYAWYLWHWPVLLLGTTLVDKSDPLAMFGLVLLSLVLAALSYWLIEAPIRRSPTLIARPAWSVAAGSALMIGAYVAGSHWQHAAMDWADQPSQRRYQQVRNDVPKLYALGCDEWFSTARVVTCSFGPRNAGHTAVLMGDSIGLQWFPAIAAAFDKPDWRLLVLTKSSCPMVDVPYFYERIGRRYVECETWRKDALKLVKSLHPEVVILGSAASYPFTAAQWTDGTARVLAAVQIAGSHTFVLQASPVLPFDGPACLSRRAWRAGLLPERRHGCTATQHPLPVHRWIAEAIGRYEAVHALDFTEAICPEGRCVAERNGIVVYRDNQHLTASFVESLTATVLAQLSQPDQVPATPLVLSNAAAAQLP